MTATTTITRSEKEQRYLDALEELLGTNEAVENIRIFSDLLQAVMKPNTLQTADQYEAVSVILQLIHIGAEYIKE
jgi:hypothetical protein